MKNILASVSAVLLLVLFATPPAAHAASPDAAPVPQDNQLSGKTPGTETAPVTVPTTSVLERFRTYSGPRTPAALTELFAAPLAADVLQQPKVVLSDGATAVRITITPGSPDSKAPNVAFKGARLISLNRSTKDEWIIEALPDAGTLKASLILLGDTGTREIPLTVSPTLPKEIDLSEAGFVAYLRGVQSTLQPQFDLNDDGRNDYLDDYIFTANYLAGPRSVADAPVAGQNTGSLPSAIDVPPEQQAPTTVDNPSPVADQSPALQGSTGSQNPASQSDTTKMTPYQRNQSIRNQNLIEMKRRLAAPPVTAPTQ
jgi:hypothetical protein